MTRLFVFRHAPTHANTSTVFMGRQDPPISREDLAVAHNLRNLPKLGENVFLFTSPLRRSRATLEAIYPEGKKTVDDRLVERALGIWEGCSEADVKRNYPQAFRTDGILDFFFTPPGGEPADRLVERVCAFMHDTGNLPNDSVVIVVTHKGVISVIRALLEERPVDDCYADNEPFLVPRAYNYDRNRALRFPEQVHKILEGQ